MVTDERVLGRAGATRGYVRPGRDQVFLLPVCMRDWVDEDHLAWFVIDVVGELDTSALHRRPGGAVGRRPYEPEMLCALVLYAYCVGVRSSRRIEDACRTDAAFRVICGGLVPDHATIARFVVDQERALEGLFVEGLRLCAAAGLCDLSVVALDGTKMAADAALDRNRDAAWIRREIAKLLSLTAAGEAPEPLPGARADAVGAGPAGPGGRLGRLRAALAVIEAEEAAAREAAREQAGALSEAARRGRAPHGRPPKDPLAALERARAAHEAALAREQAEREAARPGGSARAARRVRKAAAALAAAEQAAAKAEPASARQANVTDPDSRIMKAPGGWVQGYNAQAIANRHQIVLACDVSQQGADTTLYEPMTTKLADTLAAAGVTGTVGLMLADAGYWSHDNAAAPGPERLIATTSSHQQRRAAQQLGPASSPPPAGATPEAAMQHRLRTPEGAAAYAQRSCTIEPVFGDCKHNRAMRGFRRRGLPAAQSEWTFMHLAHNLGKLREHRTATATA